MKVSQVSSCTTKYKKWGWRYLEEGTVDIENASWQSIGLYSQDYRRLYEPQNIAYNEWQIDDCVTSWKTPNIKCGK